MLKLLWFSENLVGLQALLAKDPDYHRIFYAMHYERAPWMTHVLKGIILLTADKCFYVLGWNKLPSRLMYPVQTDEAYLDILDVIFFYSKQLNHQPSRNRLKKQIWQYQYQQR